MRFSYFVAVLFFVALSACASPEEKAAEFLAKGEALFESGDYVTAALEFRNALQIDDKLVPAWYGLARIAQEESKWREAYSLLERVTDIDPNHVEATLELSRLLLISGDVDKALLTSDRAIELGGETADALAVRAAILFRLEDVAGAVTTANAALAKDAANVDALAVLATERLGEGDAEAALRFIDRGIEADSENSPLYLLRIDALSRLEKWDEVESTHRALIAQFPEVDAFRHLLARYYLSQFQEAEAEQVYRDIVAANPGDFAPKADVVRFVNSLRGYEAAVGELERYTAAEPANAELKFLLADLHQSEGNSAARNAVLEALIAGEASDDDRRRAQGLLAADILRSGDPEAAMKIVTGILAEDPRNEQALLLKSTQSIEARDLDAAVADLRTILVDSPDSARALLLLGSAHDLQGAPDLADDMFARALEASGNQPEYAMAYAKFLTKVRRVPRAEQVLEQALPNAPRDIALLTSLAQARLALGDLEGAQQVADQLRAAQDPEGIGEQIMGAIYAGQQDYDQSIESFRAAVQAAPESTRPLVSLVRTFVRAGKPDEAHQFLDALLATNPENINARILKAQLYSSQQQFEASEAMYREVIAMAPETVAAWRGLSGVKYRTVSREEAMAVLDEALEANPEDFTLNLNRAGVFEEQQDFESAIAVYEALLAERPNADVVANNLASLLSDHRDDEASLRKAHDIALRFRRTEIPYFQDTLGWTYYRLGQVDEAQGLIERAVDAVPDQPVFRYHLGLIHQAAGNRDEARAQFEQALAIVGDGEFPFREEIEAALKSL